MDVEQKVALALGQQIIRAIALTDENERLKARVAELDVLAAEKKNADAG